MYMAESNMKISDSDRWEYDPERLGSWEIAKFDQVIKKAGEVCSVKHKDGSYIMDDEGWFEILEFLQEYRLESNFRVTKIPEE